MLKTDARARLQALMAALLFGASAPFAKLLLGDIQPVMLAALLYLGCGWGLLAVKIIRDYGARPVSREAGLARADAPWLAGAVLAGGVAAPIILMFSLKSTPAATASMLLNFEGAATSLIALAVFREALGRRVWAAIGLITLASIILSWNSGGDWGLSPGAAGILLACILWGLDNNFTRNISAKDPATIVIVKGVAAGSVSLAIALLTGEIMPSAPAIIKALILGLFSYGLSILLFVIAMRSLGAARTSAFFSSAPFIGAVISMLIFREWPGSAFLISLPIMLAGTALILREEHAHLHLHPRYEHDHRHKHDDGHHSHPHDDGWAEEHSHRHIHEEIEHRHTHTPDIHHRHMH